MNSYVCTNTKHDTYMRGFLLISMLAVWACSAQAQGFDALDFAQTKYYLKGNRNRLDSTGLNLSGFNYSGADTTGPLFMQGLYFPAQNYLGQNIWIRLRHTAHDFNGRNVGFAVPLTWGTPFRAGLGGWQGFLYQIDIYRDSLPTGPRGHRLTGLYPTNITIESLETLSDPELVNFKLLNPEATPWTLNSINFTGRNPNSQPGWSSTANSYPGTVFSTLFPPGSRMLSVVPLGGSFAEFRMSADNVSSFTYGYEYNQSFGYQGMDLKFGVPPTALSPRQAQNIRVYPSFTSGPLTVELPAGHQPFGYFTAINMLGTATRIEVIGGRTSLQGLPAGAYLLVTPFGATARVVRE